jgi:hypothetical protein
MVKAYYAQNTKFNFIIEEKLTNIIFIRNSRILKTKMPSQRPNLQGHFERSKSGFVLVTGVIHPPVFAFCCNNETKLRNDARNCNILRYACFDILHKIHSSTNDRKNFNKF